MRPEQKPGESLDRFVIRTYNSDPSKDNNPKSSERSPFKTYSDRHIAPPRTSQLMAETHGMFDDSTSNSLRSDNDTYEMIADKDGGTFSGTLEPIGSDDKLTLPYLPDPLSRGAAFRDLPGTSEGTIWRLNEKGVLTPTYLPGVKVRPGSVTMIDFGPEKLWPDALPFRLLLEEGSSQPHWDKNERLLTVQLTKAGTATIYLSSYCEEEDLKIMGIWHWIKEFVDKKIDTSPFKVAEIRELSDKLADLTQLALEGGFYMLTPSRKITLIHAVQQPLGRPEFKELHASRDAGSSFANLLGEIMVNRKSTMKLDINAEWFEQMDVIEELEPGKRLVKAYVEEVPMQSLDGPEPLEPDEREVGVYVLDADTIQFHHEFNDTKHRIIHYSATATSRFREYFPQNKNLDFTRASDKISVSIPSSARPTAPKVLYVIPTFGWKRQTSTNLIASERLGGGLRVYLDRPWFSSGEGELLGVVLLQESEIAKAKRENYKHYITQWGIDPIWKSDSVPSLPSINDFPKRVKDGSDLRLEETSEIKVKVAGHNVGYDSIRKLWYCDIEVNTRSGSYYPFMRMALARYQPDSVNSTELSKIALADYVQIAPDRSIIVTYDPYNPGTINVAFAGSTHTPPSATIDTSSYVEVSIESKRQDIDGDLGWEPASGAHVNPHDVKASGDLLWKGQVNLPKVQGHKLRLVLKEYERLYTGGGISQLTDKRLVFAESIEL